MSKKATEFQRKGMSRMYRGKEIFKPLNTGWIDEDVACVREWVANIFFYHKGDTTIMIDAGYNYDRLAEKMHWLGIDPQSIRHILITQLLIVCRPFLISSLEPCASVSPSSVSLREVMGVTAFIISCVSTRVSLIPVSYTHLQQQTHRI